MAGSHHHHQCCCCCRSCTYNPIPRPPSPTTTDSVLLTIASHLAASLQHPQSPRPPVPTPTPQSESNPPYLEPLLRRVSALESILHRLSLTQSPPPVATALPLHQAKSTQIQTPPRSHTNARAQSLRDHAARTIQTHFRSFLLRRSQMLRHLKLIAFAQTFLNNLRVKLCDHAQLFLLYQKPEARRELAERTADLLAKIDGIRSGDSIIREAKKSASRDLVGVLDVLNGSSCSNGRTKKCVAGGSNDGGSELRRNSRGSDQPCNHLTRRGDCLGRENRFFGSLNDGGLSPDTGGRDGIQRKGHESNDTPSLEKIVEILDAGNGGGSCFEDKSQRVEEVENGLPEFQWEGLSAPLPLQMEPRSFD